MKAGNPSAVFALATALAVMTGVGAQGQTTPTGTIKGHVEDVQGGALPGVTVTVSSPSLQGTRTAVTSANGDYIVPFLPAGEYTVMFGWRHTRVRAERRARSRDDERHTWRVTVTSRDVSSRIRRDGRSGGGNRRAANVAAGRPNSHDGRRRDWKARCRRFQEYATLAHPRLTILAAGGIDAAAVKSLGSCGFAGEVHVGRAARDAPVSTERVRRLKALAAGDS